jgi:hypothetical protein
MQQPQNDEHVCCWQCGGAAYLLQVLLLLVLVLLSNYGCTPKTTAYQAHSAMHCSHVNPSLAPPTQAAAPVAMLLSLTLHY